MSCYKRPHLVWLTVFVMLWASLSLSLTAIAMQIDTPPESEQAPPDPAPPAVSLPLPAENKPLSETNEQLTDSNYSETPNLEIIGGQNLQRELRWLTSSSLQPADKSASEASPAAPWSVRYTDKNSGMQFGDIMASLNGNDLVTLNRSLRGFQYDANMAQGSLTGIFSSLQSSVQTEAIAGQNSSGPYYLSTSPITPGSETVTYKGTTLVRTADYTINYATGEVYLSHGRILMPADSISVTYEVGANGAGGGQLLGLRGSYPIGKNLTIGVSHLGLKAKGNSSSSQISELETFTSQNLPGPFYLSYRPIIDGSVSITVNGKTMSPTAYTLDYPTGKLVFKNGYIPYFGAKVEVRYRISAQAPSGDRSVSGFDINWNDGKGLGINLQNAVSSDSLSPLMLTGTAAVTNEQFTVRAGVPVIQQTFRLRDYPIIEGSETVRDLAFTLIRNQDYTLNYQTGELRLISNTIPTTGTTLFVSYSKLQGSNKSAGHSAKSATVTYNKGNLNAMTRYRKVDDGFTPFDTGSNGGNTSTEWSLNYSPSTSLTLSTTGNNSLSSVNQFLNSLTPQAQTNQKNSSYVLYFHPTDLPSLMLQHSTNSSSQRDDNRVGDSTVSDNLSVSWGKKAFTATATLGRTKSTSNQAAAFSNDGLAAGDLITLQNTVNSASLNLGYHLGDKLDLGVNIAGNTLTTNSAGISTASTGKSIQTNASYRPNKNLTLSASMQSNTTKPVQPSGEKMPAQQNKNLNLNANWQLNKQFNLGLNYQSDKSDGENFGGLAPASTLSAILGWQLNDKTSVNGYMARQQLTAAGQKSPSTLVGVSAQTTPIKNTTVKVGLTKLQGQDSDGTNRLWQTQPQFLSQPGDIWLPTLQSNAFTAFSGNIKYQLGDKHDLSLTGVMLNGGGSNTSALSLGWHYNLSDALNFSIDAHRILYGGKVISDQNNNSMGLNAALTWHF